MNEKYSYLLLIVLFVVYPSKIVLEKLEDNLVI